MSRTSEGEHAPWGKPIPSGGRSSGHAPLPADQYQILVEHAPVMIWRAGLDAKCDYFNETWLRFTGKSLEEELGDGWMNGVHPEDLDRCMKSYLANFERRQTFEMEYRLRRHDGAWRYIIDRGTPFSNAEGDFAGFVGSCADVHERKEADRAKAGFLSLVAHELRTPLTSMNVFLEAVRRKAARGQPVDSAVLTRLKAQSDRVSAMVRALGDISRLEEGVGLSLHVEELDLVPLVKSVIDLFQATSGSRIHAGAPHAFSVYVPAHAWIRGDRQRVEQVLVDLLDNAVKFSPDGGEVRVELKTDGVYHRLCVHDEGIGIPAGDVPFLGRRYFRASNAPPENFPGLGLGLAIARELVERQGGQLDIQSEQGQGTTAAMVFPALGAPSA